MLCYDSESFRCVTSSHLNGGLNARWEDAGEILPWWEIAVVGKCRGRKMPRWENAVVGETVAGRRPTVLAT